MLVRTKLTLAGIWKLKKGISKKYIEELWADGNLIISHSACQLCDQDMNPVATLYEELDPETELDTDYVDSTEEDDEA